MDHILATLNIVIPIFTIIALGYFLKEIKIINESFVTMAMKLIFTICLPGMLFIKVSKGDMNAIFTVDNIKFVTYAFIGTLFIFIFSKIFAKFFVPDINSRGTFVQGSFRSNYIIMGSSMLLSMFGDIAIERMALLVIVIVPLYNILAILVLSENLDQNKLNNIVGVLKNITKNPLIIAILLGFIVAFFKIELPIVINSTVSMLGSIGTPLGLLGIGAYLAFDELKSIKISLYAVALKLIVFPAIATYIAYLLGFSYMDSAIIFVLFGSPSAISSFIMATALNGDSRLAANIVIIGTGLSLFTYLIGLTSLAFLYGI